MKITMLAGEQGYDPGFVVAVAIAPEGGNLVIREAGGIVSVSRELNHLELPDPYSVFCAVDVKRAFQNILNRIAHEEQKKRKWRDQDSEYQEGQVV